ncbi:MAG: DUF2336 domain-containing protein [Alphaproteobacteria bacterium]|nr:DUF2336 domain-containing protein [Alphaproteobacteria bacterium]
MTRLPIAGRRKAAAADHLEPISYEQSKALARAADVKVRRDLAKRRDLRPEILYFLAEDASELVRREVASNPKTPAQADMLLAADANADVRATLARKIAPLARDSGDDTPDHVRDHALKALDTLAHDQLPKVRAIVAEEMKSATGVPRATVLSLARDVALMVSAPALEFSPLLSDTDLIEVIEGAPVKGALSCIARRTDVGTAVADAIVETRDVDAVTNLLANDSAQIREETLDRVIDQAPEIEPWHRPLAHRPDLPPRAVERIAGFVGSALIVTLAERNGLDPADLREVTRAVQSRLKGEAADAGKKAGNRPAADSEQTADTGVQAATERNDRSQIVQDLVRSSGFAPAIVERILHSRSPRAVTALAWKAGLNMRTALYLQLRTPRAFPAPRF